MKKYFDEIKKDFPDNKKIPIITLYEYLPEDITEEEFDKFIIQLKKNGFEIYDERFDNSIFDRLYEQIKKFTKSTGYLNSIKLYFDEIKKIPSLSPDDEIKLFHEFKNTKDIKIRNKLILSNLRTVLYIARNYLKFKMPFLDIIEDGNIGLIIAIEKFDPTRGYKLNTYAPFWIRQQIQIGIYKYYRLSQYLRNQYKRIPKLTDILLQKLGHKPDVNTVLEELNISSEWLIHIKPFINNPLSLDAPIGNNQETLMDFVQDMNTVNIEDELQREEINKLLDKFFESLDDKSRFILEHRLGINGADILFLTEIGNKLNLSTERIRQRRNILMENLQHFIEININK